MSKKIFIIFGHNNYKSDSSFNAAVRDVFIDEAKKNGHIIDLLNIYEDNRLKFWDGSKPNEQILDYRKRLEQTDVMLIMSPCHNYVMNSATENFIANIFTPPWSFSYKKIIGNWGYPVPNALKNKTAIISMTYGGPSFFVSAIIQQIPKILYISTKFEEISNNSNLTSFNQFRSIFADLSTNFVEISTQSFLNQQISTVFQNKSAKFHQFSINFDQFRRNFDESL